MRTHYTVPRTQYNMDQQINIYMGEIRTVAYLLLLSHQYISWVTNKQRTMYYIQYAMSCVLHV